ncbi:MULTISPECIES: YggN family protein [unclassified Pseudoalteromonas]|uniref:YggN family protein n=1 Tax=unclassified Pseudoalteromonas TaxID=194690 RepID=UPI001B3A598F|nr:MULTISPECIES: YggN family protein [unclassified Pseudoalteromonas]MBQ4846494.1 YggN family protein [Pseudoalteromonas sp. MMG005]MBQ4849399.1 YggN family protein [Pseudoalteromonas sp. MMG012]
MSFIKRCSLLLSMLPLTCFAQGKCEVELGHGLIITDSVIRIVDKGQTRVQINNDTQLLIQGYWIDLSEQETQVLYEYSKGIRDTVPELVSLATDGVNLGLSAIEQVVEGMSDKEPEVLKTQLQYVERALMDKFKRGDDFFFIAPQSLSKIDDFFTKEISQKIHSAVHGSLGAILVSLGDAFKSREGNIEDRITDMSQRMDIITKEIDKSLEKKAQQLESKAEEYCECLNTLDETEARLQAIVPDLTAYDLVQIRS